MTARGATDAPRPGADPDGASSPHDRRTLGGLVRRVLAAPGPVRLVAVDGPAGSGKSTFAAALGRALGRAPVVDLDDLFGWTDLTGWWPRLEAEVLQPLLAGRPARWSVRDWHGDPGGLATAGHRTAPPHPAVVLDGVGSSRAALAPRLAVAVWVPGPSAPDRLRRLVARDGEGLRDRLTAWQAMEAAFFAQDRPLDRPHVAVSSREVRAVHPGGAPHAHDTA